MSKTSLACFLLCRIVFTLSSRSILTLFSSTLAAAELTWRFLEAAAIFSALRSRDPDERGRHEVGLAGAPPVGRRANDSHCLIVPRVFTVSCFFINFFIYIYFYAAFTSLELWRLCTFPCCK